MFLDPCGVHVPIMDHTNLHDAGVFQREVDRYAVHPLRAGNAPTIEHAPLHIPDRDLHRSGPRSFKAQFRAISCGVREHMDPGTLFREVGRERTIRCERPPEVCARE